jgi:hypothetical protein
MPPLDMPLEDVEAAVRAVARPHVRPLPVDQFELPPADEVLLELGAVHREEVPEGQPLCEVVDQLVAILREWQQFCCNDEYAETDTPRTLASVAASRTSILSTGLRMDMICNGDSGGNTRYLGTSLVTHRFISHARCDMGIPNFHTRYLPRRHGDGKECRSGTRITGG